VEIEQKEPQLAFDNDFQESASISNSYIQKVLEAKNLEQKQKREQKENEKKERAPQPRVPADQLDHNQV